MPFKRIRRKVADSAGVKRIEIQTTVKKKMGACDCETAVLLLTLMDACAKSKRHHTGIKGACGNGNDFSL